MKILACAVVILVIMRTQVIIAQDAVIDFVEAEVNNPRPYTGEQIVYTLRLYSKVQRAEQPSIVLPDFAGFWKQEIDPIRKYPTIIGDQAYEVTERRIALFPAYTQSLTINETAVVIRDDLSSFGDVLLTVPMTVDVQQLPQMDDLEGFDGAVGQFEIFPTLNRQETRLGEPVTLSLTVRGTGNVEQLPAPDLPDSDSWRILEDSSTYRSFEFEGALIGEKTFEWLLTPILEGDQAIPEISLRYFDPSSQSYQTISTTPITVSVLPVDEATMPDSIPLPIPEHLPLKPVPALLNAGGNLSSIWFIPFWVVPPLAAIVVWWEMRRRWRIRRDMQAHQRSEALKNALTILKRGGNPETHTGRDALLTYFADKLNTASSTLRYEDIEAALRDHTDNPELVAMTAAYLAAIDQALYAPANPAQGNQPERHAAALLHEIDQQWR